MNQTNTSKNQSSNNSSASAGNATIGESVKIIGDLSGKEDLVINGTVEGTVDFRENNVSVGDKGKVNANITARNITIAGELKGELRGSEQVSIKPSGRVTGDIRAPRVVLNDGCQFKGMVDMEEKPLNPAEHKPAAPNIANKPFPDRPSPAPILTRRKS
ncbi:MAG: bactofilin family protein [bacterium]